jgi:hypothetical protein
MTQPPAADPVTAASPRVSCPLRGGASVDVERCLTCAYFKGAAACGTDPRELVYAGPNWWRLLIP